MTTGSRQQLRGRGRRHSAFTIFELMLVMAIMGTLAAMAVPRYASASTNHRIEMAARRLVSDLEIARVRARAGGKPLSVVFDTAASTYTIVGLTGLDSKTGNYTVRLGAEPHGTRIVSASFGGKTTVAFDRYGYPAAGGTVTLGVGASRKTVSLDAGTGRATIP